MKISSVIPDYATAKPFPSAVLEDFFDPVWARAAVALEELIDPTSVQWHTYDTPVERLRVRQSLGRDMLDWLEGLTHEIEDLTQIRYLTLDEGLYGAGLKEMGEGDFLALHRDLERHPTSGWERRVNLVLFLGDRETVWQTEWGGFLEFWSANSDGSPHRCERRIRPVAGRAVFFDPAGLHGIPSVLKCPPSITRRSVQVFYYAQPRGEATPRTRRAARFVGRDFHETVDLLNDFRRRTMEQEKNS